MKTRRTRITYNFLCKAVDDWNREHNLTPDKRGYMVVLNDGNIHWLAYICKDKSSAVLNFPLADGTCRGCYNLLATLNPV